MQKNKKFRLLGLLIIFLLGGLLVFLMTNGPSDDGPDELGSQSQSVAQLKRSLKARSASEQSRKSEDSEAQELRLQTALTELAKALPAWMNEKGMTFEDRREVFGSTVLRSRARYEWEDGKQMEIEISDMGLDVEEVVIKALGFDPDLEEGSDELGVSEVADDEGETLSNYQYNHADQAGSLQVLFGERYIIEIKIQGLPEEAFQEILDRDIAFDQLYSTPPIGK